MHGYEIRRRLSTTLGPFWTMSFGSLYPCLKRLRRAEMVNERPAEESRSRRCTTYEITPDGERFFFDQLERGAAYDTDRFRLRFAFFRYLPRDARIGLLERRKAYISEKLEEFSESLRNATQRIDQYSLSLIEHQTDVARQDIVWLEGLIDQERGGKRRARRAK